MPSTSQGPKKGRMSSSKGPRTKLGYDSYLYEKAILEQGKLAQASWSSPKRASYLALKE